MSALLSIPWFRLDPWPVPLPLGSTFHVQPFGVLAAAAMLVCSRMAAVRARQLQLSKRELADFLARVTLVGILSAYLLNIVLYLPEAWAEIAAQPWLVITRWYGLSSYGGFMGGALAAWHFAYVRRASLLKLGDAWCFAFPFAWFFARLGCFSVHDHPGVPSDFALAVADWNHTGIARHDLGLYEVVWSVPVAIWFWHSRARDRAPGHYLGLLCTAYGPVRFGLDFLREDAANGGDLRIAGLTPAQYLSLALTAFGVAFLLHQRAQRDKRPQNTAKHILGLVICLSPACAARAEDPSRDAQMSRPTQGTIPSHPESSSGLCLSRRSNQSRVADASIIRFAQRAQSAADERHQAPGDGREVVRAHPTAAHGVQSQVVRESIHGRGEHEHIAVMQGLVRGARVNMG